jgi:hypothetical protein
MPCFPVNDSDFLSENPPSGESIFSLAKQDAFLEDDLEEFTLVQESEAGESVEDLALQLMRQLRAHPQSIAHADSGAAKMSHAMSAPHFEPDTTASSSRRPGLQDALNSVLSALGEGTTAPAKTHRARCRYQMLILFYKYSNRQDFMHTHIPQPSCICNCTT